MATFTISLSGSGVVNGSKSWDISDADTTLLVAYLRNRYSTATNQLALAAWTQDFVGGTIMQVRNAQQSSAPITPIVFT